MSLWKLRRNRQHSRSGITKNPKNPYFKHSPRYKPCMVLYVVRVATLNNHPWRLQGVHVNQELQKGIKRRAYPISPFHCRSLYISWSKTDYTRIEKTAYSFYVRRLADGGQEKGSRERTVMLPEGYHKRYTKQISGYEPIREVGTPINPMKA